jgi:hypothetical protein
MAASACDGTYTFWHQGLGVTAAQKTATSLDVGSWDQGLPILHFLAGAPVVVPDFFAAVMQKPVRRRRVVAYGSY